MDLDPARREHNMARWTFAGSVGVVLGPLALGVGVSLALGWRGVMGLMAGLSLALVLLGFTMPYPGGDPEARFSVRTVFKGVRDAVLSVRRPGVLRWLVLLQFSDLMLDVLLGFLALYLVDVGAATPAQASLAVAVWTGVGLLGDFALIPLLERVRGLRYLRVSALLELALFPAMLLAPEFWQKLVLLGLIGLFNAGWYAILQAQLYAALPGQSGTALAVKNVSGMVGALIPLTLGLVAQRWGLDVAMWLLLAGPIALVIGLAGQRSEVTVED
jgi:FSR family fosmidomycin resistance protein-like MFS transporter